MIDRVDESQANVGVVVGHEHHVKQLLALGVNLPESCVHRLQSLETQIRVIFPDNAPPSAPCAGRVCGWVSVKNLISRCGAHRWHEPTRISESQHVCMRSVKARRRQVSCTLARRKPNLEAS